MKVRKGGGKEIPLIQGKEQHRCIAEAGMKSYRTNKVRETQVRCYLGKMQEGIRGQTH